MKKSNTIRFLLVIALKFYLCTGVTAHEFWIEPEKFIVKGNEKILGNLFVGQMMKGVSYGYYPRHFKRFEIKTNNSIKSLNGRIADKPAIKIPAQGNSLVTIIHATTDSEVFYNDWTTFEKFLIEKNLNLARSRHLQNDFPKKKFKEIYSRYAKALISSGSGTGLDQKTGLEVEIVLKENPYTEDVTNGLTIEFFYKGLPKANTQIEIFSRDINKIVTRQVISTNSHGHAVIKVQRQTDYMINAVVMRQPDPDKTVGRNLTQPILWESLWASTSFTVP